MIKLYTSPSCSSCRKVKIWFKEHDIPYEEINIQGGTMTPDNIKEILSKSLDGTDEIISRRSKIMKEQKVELDSMSLNDLCNFIIKNPTVLKRPIIVDDRKIQVGYNEDEICVFIPKSQRKPLILDEQFSDEEEDEIVEDKPKTSVTHNKVGRPRKNKLR